MARKKTENGEVVEAPQPVLDKAKEKRDRFLRLVSPRVNKLLKAMDAVGRLGNRATYEWTVEEMDRVIDAIDKAAEVTIRKLRELPEVKPAFVLPPSSYTPLEMP